MKKKIYFYPSQPEQLDEFVTIEYGKIREIKFYHYEPQIPPYILNRLKKEMPEHKFPENKSTYKHFKNFHIPIKFKKADKYIKKKIKAKYTHEIFLPELSELKEQSGELPNEFLLKALLHDRRIFININWFEVIKIFYHSFSFSEAITAIQITVVIAIISVSIMILSLFI